MAHNNLKQQVERLIQLHLNRYDLSSRYIRVGTESVDLAQELAIIKQAISNVYNNPELLKELNERVDNIEALIKEKCNAEKPNYLTEQVKKNTEDIIYILQLLQMGQIGDGHCNQLDSFQLDNGVLV